MKIQNKAILKTAASMLILFGATVLLMFQPFVFVVIGIMALGCFMFYLEKEKGCKLLKEKDSSNGHENVR